MSEQALLDDLDPGIRQYVKVLREAGVETFESCQGGNNHAFTEPTIRFHGGVGAGWHAMNAALSCGLPVLALHRTWYVEDSNVPTGPHWQLVFRAVTSGGSEHG